MPATSTPEDLHTRLDSLPTLIELSDELHDAATQVAEGLAARDFGFETLAVRGSNRLDYRRVGVVAVRHALVKAYLAGRREHKLGLVPD